MKIACVYGCGREIDPDAPGSYREVRGWEEVRRKGGANKITLRVTTGRTACTVCIERLKHGINPLQEQLL